MTTPPKPEGQAPVVVSIIGTGRYNPERVLTNADLEKSVETTDEWIVSRTGIRERRIAGEHETNSEMGTRAAQAALEQAGVKAEDVDLIICGTVTGDMPFPATACLIQRNLGANKATAFDVGAACTGFITGLEVAKQLIAGGNFHTALVIGSERISRVVDWTDRNTCVLFG
ncbi:MAG: 3-oxoacyl-ACP synthase, partial [Verrucomicrobia bacterium]|nr:3-oxoacyl-ACP synthase [Verrucomicrobiota bacterium]